MAPTYWDSSSTTEATTYAFYYTTSTTSSNTVTYWPATSWEVTRDERPPEDIARYNEELVQRQAERERRYADEQAQREAAAARARELLVAMLDDEQRADLEAHREFTVISQSGKRYRVTHRMAHGVFEIDQDGQRVTEFCIVPRSEQIPIEDHMLAEKLMLEADEERFLSIANRLVLRRAA